MRAEQSVRLAVPQFIHQAFHRLQQRARVSIHSINGVAMHWRQRCFLIALQELANTNDDIQGRAQLMTDRLQEFGTVSVVGKKHRINAGLFLWDIYWLHTSCSL